MIKLLTLIQALQFSKETELRERELNLRAELTRILVEFSEESAYRLCLFLDSYEQLAETDPELDSWLWEQALLPLAKASPQSVVVVTCGWERAWRPV